MEEEKRWGGDKGNRNWSVFGRKHKSVEVKCRKLGGRWHSMRLKR